MKEFDKLVKELIDEAEKKWKYFTVNPKKKQDFWGLAVFVKIRGKESFYVKKDGSTLDSTWTLKTASQRGLNKISKKEAESLITKKGDDTTDYDKFTISDPR